MTMRLIYLFLNVCCFAYSLTAQPSETHNLTADSLPRRWDEALPLGNGHLGALIWQSGNKLRISLDRADVWDLRPIEPLRAYKHADVVEAVKKGDLSAIHAIGDVPYDTSAGPTKLPVAALEFDISALGPVRRAELDLQSAKCLITWKNGVSLEIFIHATEPIGWAVWRGKGINGIRPVLIPPAYQQSAAAEGNQVVDGASLARLGYQTGVVKNKGKYELYEQKIWGDHRYQVAVGSGQWPDATGVAWSVSSSLNVLPNVPSAGQYVAAMLNLPERQFGIAQRTHVRWWQRYWMASDIRIPDPVLQKQYYLDMYKFGCVARKGAPPITLQAIWTADNGKLPPWKGDLHHDLNTQLSYWPAYVGNHLTEAESFTDWLWNHRDTFKAYTKRVFGTPGLNVPGVTTLDGQPMGGWHQYSLSPTVSAWLAQHFYWQWSFSGDSTFLNERARPWIQDVALHLDSMLVQKDSVWTLELSSSPEFHDNSLQAWYLNRMTSYDAALYQYIYLTHHKLTGEYPFGPRAPKYVLHAKEVFPIAPGEPYAESHRHFSHLMGFMPLGLVNKQELPNTSLHFRLEAIRQLEQYGAGNWTGYSHAWLANLYTRIGEGEKAAKALRDFAQCYCGPNSFHLNGNQCLDRKDLSNMHYRPFTLEGNFAAAAALQSMFLQSEGGITEIFPAVPESWKEASFSTLRAEGGFLLSATRTGGKTQVVEIEATQNGRLVLVRPFQKYHFEGAESARPTEDFQHLTFRMKKGEKVRLTALTPP